MRKIPGLFGLILLLAIFTSCGKKLDTLTAPRPVEQATAADNSAVDGNAVAAGNAAATDDAAAGKVAAAGKAASADDPSGAHRYDASDEAIAGDNAAAASGSSRIGTSTSGRYSAEDNDPPIAAVDGNQHSVSYTGFVQDLLIPIDPSVVKVTVTLNGGDGGYARVHDTDIFGGDHEVKANGGAGANVGATFGIGNGPGQIPHGSILRFVVGGRGANGSSGGVVGVGFDYGGGGGGTGVLYRAPNAGSFALLAVAGGGAGAYQGMFAYSSVDHEPGQGGRSGTSGGDGNGDLGPGPGGTNGNGGGSNPALGSFGGGGGGANTPGGGVDCVGIPDLNPSQAGEGGPGLQDGGYGGDADGCFSFTWRNGGFGYGGGGAGSGAGGGGGGFSGGGVGGTTGRGGGGGSYLGGGSSTFITPGGSISDPANGAATYQFTLNAPPLVSCKSHEAPLDANGQASIVASDVTGSASDPEGGALQFALSRSTFDCSNVGTNNVTLTVTDDVGQTVSCDAAVSVVDKIAPIVLTKNISVQLDANGLAAITPSMVNNGSYDNCSIQSYSLDIAAFDCGDVGTRTVTLTATDVNGNGSSATAQVTVEDVSRPVISAVAAAPAVLWPPNHAMRPVVVTISSQDNCPSSSCRIVSVSSNEPVNGAGDGNAEVDWAITGDHTVSLRAERSGIDSDRVYTITVECTDAAGNTSRSSTEVTVPHDLRARTGG